MKVYFEDGQLWKYSASKLLVILYGIIGELTLMAETKIIAAFPACGKTYYTENREDNYTVLDCDSSLFSWLYKSTYKFGESLKGCKRVQNTNFPANYVEYIKKNIGKYDYILISSHASVREALKDAGIDFAVVFPKQSLKEEWVGRCFIRGSGEEFCKLIADHWDDWILQMEQEVIHNNRNFYRLDHNEYLSDAIKYI